MIDQHPVSGLHLPEVLQGQIVLDPVPNGRVLAGQVIVTVRGRLGFHDPVGGHNAGCGGWWRLVEVGGGRECLYKPPLQSAIVPTSSPITSASVLPDRLRTLKEGSPPSTRCS